MTDLPYRPFADDAAIRHVGEGLLARTLPREEWTHEAHLGATLWLLRDQPDVDVDAEIATIISRYNESVGGVNDATQGYHDSITRAYVAGIREHLANRPHGEALAIAANALLASPAGRRDWPLRFYSRELLFSVAARPEFRAARPRAVPVGMLGSRFRDKRRESAMGMLDGLLGQIASNVDVAGLAAKVGITPDQAESAIAALGQAHSAPGDTVETAADSTGLPTDTLQQIVAHIGGEGALGRFASLLAEQSGGAAGIFGKVSGMIDQNGDGSATDEIATFTKGLFGKS